MTKTNVIVNIIPKYGLVSLYIINLVNKPNVIITQSARKLGEPVSTLVMSASLTLLRDRAPAT